MTCPLSPCSSFKRILRTDPFIFHHVWKTLDDHQDPRTLNFQIWDGPRPSPRGLGHPRTPSVFTHGPRTWSHVVLSAQRGRITSPPAAMGPDGSDWLVGRPGETLREVCKMHSAFLRVGPDILSLQSQIRQKPTQQQ